MMLFLIRIKETSYAAPSVLQGKQWERVLHRSIVLHQDLGEKGKEVGKLGRTGDSKFLHQAAKKIIWG